MNQHIVNSHHQGHIDHLQIPEQLFRFKDFAVEYKIFGDGPETIVCFHGFGRTATDFEIFTPLLQANQRILAINLFAHGASKFPEERIDQGPFKPIEWKNLLEALFDQLQITTFHLVGFSMGGRIVMKTIELMSERILSVLLLAPDGFKINAIYKFASGTMLGKSIYRSLIKNPNFLFLVAKKLNQLGILNDKLHRFVHVHLDTKEKRIQVYEAWLIYKLFFSNQDTLAELIKTKNIKFNMIFGKFDSVIRPHLGEAFSKKLNSEKHLHIIEAGHRLLDQNTLNYIVKNNLWT